MDRARHSSGNGLQEYLHKPCLDRVPCSSLVSGRGSRGLRNRWFVTVGAIALSRRRHVPFRPEMLTGISGRTRIRVSVDLVK